MSDRWEELKQEEEITRAFEEIGDQPRLFADRAVPLLYEYMRSVAMGRLWRQSANCTLRPTELVHEVYLRLRGSRTHWQNRSHFLACAANAMRQILVDHARKRRSQKRGGKYARVPLDDYAQAQPLSLDDILSVEQSLNRLQELDPTSAELVVLRFYGGLTVEEAAEAVGLGLTAAKSRLTFAQTWMHRDMRAGPQ